MQHRTVGVDIGGTKILGVLWDPSRERVVARQRRDTPRENPRALTDAVVEVVADLTVEARSTGSAFDEPAAIGIGLPGLVDRTGLLRYGPNVPGVVDLDLGEVLTRRFSVPVVIDNDAAHAAVAEHRLGAARGARHALIVTLGTGIGGALIVDGRVVRGANGFAGEPGHMLVDPSGPLCACGRRGCWESVASGAGLVNLAQQVLDAGGIGRGARLIGLAGGDRRMLRGEHVVTAFDEGDEDAAEVVRRFSYWVAQGLASLVNLLDPAIIVLGGGLAGIGDRFLDDVRAQLMPCALGGSHRPAVPVMLAALGPDAGAIGGAVRAADRIAPVGGEAGR